MKVGIFAFSMLIALSSFAAESADHWICDVRNPQWPWPKPSEIKASLAEPVVTLTDYIREEDGSYRPKVEELITAKTVSAWKADKSKCQIQAGFHQGEFVNNYEFFFTCGGLQGSFSLDFRDNTGFYTEQLTSRNVRRSISLENCRAEE